MEATEKSVSMRRVLTPGVGATRIRKTQDLPLTVPVRCLVASLCHLTSDVGQSDGSQWLHGAWWFSLCMYVCVCVCVSVKGGVEGERGRGEREREKRTCNGPEKREKVLSESGHLKK